MKLWQAVRAWLIRHQANLISELPGMLLDQLKGGDFSTAQYEHVIVDEFQDLTAGEQELFAALCSPTGSFLALGDPRQSIYAFRGNDREGLAKLEPLLGPDRPVVDMPMAECQRCPGEIVEAANQLMGLYPAQPMVPGNPEEPNTHVVVWETPRKEAKGMAGAILKNLNEYPNGRHLVMVTRRQFGYWLRQELHELDPEISVDLSFSESLLETWRFGKHSCSSACVSTQTRPHGVLGLGIRIRSTGRGLRLRSRNSGAYLQLLDATADNITADLVKALSDEPRSAQRGQGGAKLWDRARRFVFLTETLELPEDPEATIRVLCDPTPWIATRYEDADTAELDLQLLLDKALLLLEEAREKKADATPSALLRSVAKRLRYQIATREPFIVGDATDLQIATLWGAKGVTAEHVYVLGLSGETIPGQRRTEYPGTEAEYVEEQRRLFYVSLTRSKRTLVLSRAAKINRNAAPRLGLELTPGTSYIATLKMCPFLRDIITFLPKAVRGENWTGP